jgi:hypothetical protein
MYLLLVCPYILLSTLFSDMILISTLLLFMFFSVAPEHKSGLDHRVFEVSRSHTHTHTRAHTHTHTHGRTSLNERSLQHKTNTREEHQCPQRVSNS